MLSLFSVTVVAIVVASMLYSRSTDSRRKPCPKGSEYLR